MQTQAKIPAFTDFSHILLESEVMINPAEIHGILCGLICIEQELDGKFWFNTMLKLLEARDQFAMQREIIIGFYDATYRQLSGAPDEFQLVLPAGEAAFAERARALSRWCKGFLYGFGLTNRSITKKFSDEAQEAVRCMEEIAKLDFDQIEVDEKDKNAYLVVAEFVRDAVITIYLECVGQPIEDNTPAEMQVWH